MEYDQQMSQIQDAVLQSISDGLIVTDFTGTFRFVNHMTEKILGIDRSKIIGQTIAKLFARHPGNDEFMEAILDTVYQRNGIQTRFVPFHTNGRTHQLRITSSVMRDADGKASGITIILSDMSELLEMKDALMAMDRINALNQQLTNRNQLLCKTFGQFLSDDIVRELLETPGALEPGGKKKTISIMMSDLRNFTAISENLDASDLIVMLNHYLGKMTEIIQNRKGTIIEFLGDGILAIFGAPVYTETHVENAVAAALEMQAAMRSVNRWNGERGFPHLEMGIGLDCGEVIVGTIGSERQMKYSAIGSHVNRCGRIESYTTGGQVMISPDVRERVHAPLTIEKEMRVFPKGLEQEVVLYQVSGIGAPYDIQIIPKKDAPVNLKKTVPVCFYQIDGKHVQDKALYGGITAVGADCAILETDTEMEIFDNLEIDAGGQLLCKVVEKREQGYLVLYTSIPSGYRRWIRPFKT